MPLGFNYCTDEDVAMRAMGDYSTICPVSQLLAEGSDGQFLMTTPWELQSDSVDFQAQGVHAGNVIWLTQPRSVFRAEGCYLVVDGVNGHNANLRRLGKDNNMGQAPSTPAGLSNVHFTIRTFDPQIDVASDEANRWFGVDPNVAGRRPSDMYEPRALQQFCVLHVLTRAIAASMRGGSGSYLQVRLGQLETEFADLRDRSVVRWGQLGLGDAATTAFGCRARR